MKRTHNPKLVTLAVSLAAAMMTLDSTVVQIAVPSISNDLSATLSNMQWVLNGYVLTFASIPIAARSLADRYGRLNFSVLEP